MAIKFAVNNSLSAVTSLPTAISTGSMTLLQTQTASSSSTIDFTSNIDSTYDVYVFKLIEIHPQTDDTKLTFNFSTDGGSNYNVTKTSTMFRSLHYENDSTTQLQYVDDRDLAQSTGFQDFFGDMQGADNDQANSGTLILYNPASTTFVKHYIGNSNSVTHYDASTNGFLAGYGNTTSAINAVQFKMNSGNIDSGVIKLYGIS